MAYDQSVTHYGGSAERRVEVEFEQSRMGAHAPIAGGDDRRIVWASSEGNGFWSRLARLLHLKRV
jgi:hypothetical protein